MTKKRYDLWDTATREISNLGGADEALGIDDKDLGRLQKAKRLTEEYGLILQEVLLAHTLVELKQISVNTMDIYRKLAR